ncbi:cupin domain-containing protein [Candidatus Nitrospira salsa]
MTPQEPSDEMIEQAALYALGALEGLERESFEKIVAEGCATCQAVKDFQDIVGRLGSSVAPIAPPASLRATLLQRVAVEQKAKGVEPTREPDMSTEEGGFTVVRSTDDLWREVESGIRVKPLSFDKTNGRMTVLARMAPHSRYTAHRHTSPEEFYILEGSLFCGGYLLYPGDYHRAEAGTVHHETSTEDGCLMLMIFSPNNELLESLA